MRSKQPGRLQAPGTAFFERSRGTPPGGTKSLLQWVLVASLLTAANAWTMPELGEPAPSLRGHLLSGEPLDLAALRGKVVLINYFSSYCKFCAYEIGTLEAFREAHRAEGFEVLELAIDDLADRDRVARMLTTYELPGAMVRELEENGFGARYPTPTSFLIDRKGILRHRQWGAKLRHFYQEQVLPLLQE